MEVEEIKLEIMRNSGNLEYHRSFIKMVQNKTPAALKIEPQFAEYLQLYNEADEAYKKVTKSAITAQLQEADKARDETWIGIIYYIEAYLRHFDPAKRESARHLKILTDTYGKGKLAKKPLMEQTLDVINVLQDFEGKYAPHVAAVGLLPWIIELKARNIAFTNLMEDRVYESGARNHTALKEARARLNAKYYEIVKRINATALLEGPADYEDFINPANANIAKFKILMAKSSKRGKNGNEEDEDDETEDTQTNGGSK